jgi:hypothetical protein
MSQKNLVNPGESATIMDSEESPLLPTDQDYNAGKHEAVYGRFSPAKKRLIVAMVSICGLIPCESLNALSQLIIHLTMKFYYSVRDRLIYTRYSNSCKGTPFYGPHCEASSPVIIFFTIIVILLRIAAWRLVYRHLVHH